jgi:hypothetical protein
MDRMPVGLLSRRSGFLFIHRYRFRGCDDGGIVDFQPLLDRFSLRYRGHSLPAGATGPNRILGHQVVVGIVNMDYFARVRALAVKGISDIGAVMVFH